MTEPDFDLLISKTHIAIYVDDVKPNINSALIDLINCSLFKKKLICLQSVFVINVYGWISSNRF